MDTKKKLETIKKLKNTSSKYLVSSEGKIIEKKLVMQMMSISLYEDQLMSEVLNQANQKLKEIK